MAKAVKKKSHSRRKKISIVASKFNEFITKRLLDGCLDELNRKGIRKSDIAVVWVPGAFEIPVVACKMAKKKDDERRRGSRAVLPIRRQRRGAGAENPGR